MLETVSEVELTNVLRLYDRFPNVRETLDSLARGTSVDRAMFMLLRHCWQRKPSREWLKLANPYKRLCLSG